ncbi:MAG: ROK family protein [Gemmatimonadales bacterium]|nr:ROK family protein [Gemmatimonadales bacterium]
MRALGVDVGGSKLLACLADSEGRTLGRTVRETGRATGPEKACRLIVAAARELREAHGSFDVAGIGFPGQVDFPRGLVRASVMLDGWLDVALGARISEALGVPCVVDNDVNAAAVAELKQRDDDPPASMLFVSVGTGIGGAITLGPHLWRGHTGVAGEIGNTTIDRHGATCWCGRRGCLNTCASGSAMQNALGADVRLSAVTGSDHHRREDIIQAAATSLGIGIANALNLLNPALVVLGGGVSQLGPGWLEAVAAAARREAFPEAGQCRFELALAGYEAGATGAAWLALEMSGASA